MAPHRTSGGSLKAKLAKKGLTYTPQELLQKYYQGGCPVGLKDKVERPHALPKHNAITEAEWCRRVGWFCHSQYLQDMEVLYNERTGSAFEEFYRSMTIPTPSKRQNATKSKRNRRNHQHEPHSQNQCNKWWRPLAQTSLNYCCNTIPHEHHEYQRQRCRSVGRHLPLSLRLVTLAGNEIETTVPLSIYHHWEMLEDYLVEYWPTSMALTPLDVSWHFCQMRPTAP